ncbi:hypothetical protein GCM10028798_01880 [Humibacter antri]
MNHTGSTAGRRPEYAVRSGDLDVRPATSGCSAPSSREDAGASEGWAAWALGVCRVAGVCCVLGVLCVAGSGDVTRSILAPPAERLARAARAPNRSCLRHFAVIAPRLLAQ